MSGKPHKGSWGNGYIIEQKPNQKRITCNFCKYYNDDGSCKVKPIVVSEVGYDYWKYCNAFYLSDWHNTIENRDRVARGKKVRSTYGADEVAVTLEETIQKEFPWRRANKRKTNRVEVGSIVCVYDMIDHVEEVFKIVRQEDADVLKGKLSIETPVGKGLLQAEEGNICAIETPSGTIKYKVLKIK